MAFSTKIKFFQARRKKPICEINVNWWDEEELRKKYAFTEQYESGYYDYFLEVDKKQLTKIHRQQLIYLESGIYSIPEWRKQLDPVVVQIESILKSEKKFRLIQIQIYEWESGY